MISYYDIMYDIMYTYNMILLVISCMISYHDIPGCSTPPSIAPAAAEAPCYAKTSGVSEVAQKGAKRFVPITILAGYTLCSCPLGRLGGH